MKNIKMAPSTQPKSFVEAVRNQRVTQPSHRNFSPLEWSTKYQAFPKTVGDERLHDAGLWFFQQFSSARTRLDALPLLSAVANPRALVAFVNHETSITMQPAPVVDGDTYYPHKEVDRYEALGPRGAPVNRQSYTEGIVSALSLPLRSLLRGQQIGNPAIQSVDPLQDLAAHLRLAATYAQLETFWRECVWNSWWIDNQGPDPVLQPGDLPRHANCMVGQYRTQMLGTEHLHYFLSAWNNPRLGILRETILDTSFHAEVDKRGRLSLRKFNSKEMRSDMPRALEVILTGAEEMYWNELLVRPLPGLKGVTIRQLLSAWRIIMSIGQTLADQINPPPKFSSRGQLITGYAAKFSKQDLLRALSKSLVPAEALMTVFECFVFDGEKQIDPWLHPLVPTNDDYSILVATVNTTNPIRLIEFWMRAGGLSLDERGDLFEEYVEGVVKKAVQRGRFANHCEVTSSGFKFRPRPVTLDAQQGPETRDHEEIDLAVRVGNVILVCEDKCCVFPVEPTDYYSYFEKISDGQAQAQRKAEFVKLHIDDFMCAFFPAYAGASEGLRVVPVVITNLPFGSGSVGGIGAPCVTDLILLRRYLGEGVIEPPSVSDRDGRAENLGKPTPLYRNLTEFSDNLSAFLRFPPVIEGYRAALRPQGLYMELADGTLQKVITLHVSPEAITDAVLREVADWAKVHCS